MSGLTPAERRALIACAFIAAAVMVPPLDLAAVGIDFLLGVALLVFHRRASARERPPPRSPPPPEAPTTSNQPETAS